MKNRSKVKALLDYCIDERKYIPEISRTGEHTWDMLDEEIMLLDYYLNQGKVPNMDDYLESTTDSVALWLLELNTTYDGLVEKLLEENEWK